MAWHAEVALEGACTGLQGSSRAHLHLLPRNPLSVSLLGPHDALPPMSVGPSLPPLRSVQGDHPRALSVGRQPLKQVQDGGSDW